MSVYLIRPTICYEAGDWYIGSTKEKLIDRMCRHRYWFRVWKNGGRKTLSSSVLFEKYGVDNCEIVALETNIPVEDLIWRERNYLETCRAINRIKRPLLTPEERKSNKMEYTKKIKDHKVEYDKNRRAMLCDQIKAKKKAYYEANKERINQARKDKRKAQNITI
jgi:hypothetical protein